MSEVFNHKINPCLTTAQLELHGLCLLLISYIRLPINFTTITIKSSGSSNGLQLHLSAHNLNTYCTKPPLLLQYKSSLVLLPEQAQHKHTPTLARMKAIKRYPDTTVQASKEQLELLQVKFCVSSCHNNHYQLKLLSVWTIICVGTSGSHRTNATCTMAQPATSLMVHLCNDLNREMR